MHRAYTHTHVNSAGIRVSEDLCARESVSSWLFPDKHTCITWTVSGSVYVRVTIDKHTQCKQMVMINRDTGLYPQFQLQRENSLKKFFKKIACPEVHFYCFPFLLLAIICMAKGEQRIDYLTRMFTRVKLGSLKMKHMPRGKKKKEESREADSKDDGCPK